MTSTYFDPKERDMASRKTIIQIFEEPVELYKILKFENIAASGGEAKYLIQDGEVRVNGQVETRKRKKIMHGDVIEVFDQVLVVERAGERHS